MTLKDDNISWSFAHFLQDCLCWFLVGCWTATQRWHRFPWGRPLSDMSSFPIWETLILVATGMSELFFSFGLFCIQQLSRTHLRFLSNFSKIFLFRFYPPGTAGYLRVTSSFGCVSFLVGYFPDFPQNQMLCWWLQVLINFQCTKVALTWAVKTRHHLSSPKKERIVKV